MLWLFGSFWTEGGAEEEEFDAEVREAVISLDCACPGPAPSAINAQAISSVRTLEVAWHFMSSS
jgi:hypothetical protein